MNTRATLRAFALAGAAVACLAPAWHAAIPAPAQQAPADDELTIGQATFNELKARSEIIDSSPLYDVLLPVIQPIMKAAQPQYEHPFKVYLVHEAQPNAFATPGGYIYVVDALLYFAKNKEQLAGTLCHEIAHAIHHDSRTLLEKEKQLRWKEVGGVILIGPTRAHILAIALLGKLHSELYSREAEARADLTGADVCAAAGSNPWGLVWLFEDFKAARTRDIPQFLSDHPSDQNRINALEQHFKSNPAVFGRFDSNRQSATPFEAPKRAPVVFLR
ncbi:MAG TPA: M48 family metalloprotease [Gemmatimonadales bacterium]|nr:M48 family metalloprotease [Gemmatimonadales bacterium]